MTMESEKRILIHPDDNVEVSLASGQKVARRAIPRGGVVVKYGFPIGKATVDIPAGEWVHTHNMKTRLTGEESFSAPQTFAVYSPKKTDKTFLGYRRPDGSVGIRNEVWIIPTVGCVNGAARKLAELTGAVAFTHPFGCSQLGGDLLTTQRVLAGLIRHPNAAAVLVLGLGCEENGIGRMKEVLGDVDPRRVAFLNTQDCTDEIEEGRAILSDLFAYADTFRREPISLSALRIGLKCGGSDGFSGITANPLVGRVAERFADVGGAALMTEIPETFGGEKVLLDRCVSPAVHADAARMMRAFREYFLSHGEGIADTPSPGNRAGGITTLEEKSLGCVQKGGRIPVTGVLGYGMTPDSGGLWLVDGPGNDIVAVTNLSAAGAHLILFTTGRGTPLGGPVPTLKISTNSPLAKRKPGWIDFDAGTLAEGADPAQAARELYDLVIRTAEGLLCRSEINQTREISIFKDGVIL